MERRQIYFALNTKIAYMSDKDICDLKKINGNIGYGMTSIVTIDGVKVFMKQIGITDLEYDNKFDTINHYNLPVYYNYGIGSAGINSFRELLLHIKTSNWVLNSDIENFPLLYHYRIIKKNDVPIQKFDDKFKLHADIKKWNNNKNIEKYILDKNNSKYQIVMFLEYFPEILGNWLKCNFKQTKSYLSQIIKIINFLKKNGIIHLDTHDRNILVDNNNNIYLTDFGLVLDMEFKLSNEEKDFFRKNNYFAYADVISNIYNIFFSMVAKKEKYFSRYYNFNFRPMHRKERVKLYKKVYDNIYEISRYMKCDEKYASLLKKYWEFFEINNTFLYVMANNDKKDTVFPNNDVKKLLKNY